MTQNSKSPGDPRLRWVHKFICTIVSNKTSFFYGVPKTKLLTAYLVYRLEPLVWLAGWSHLPDILVLNEGMENTFDNCSSFWKTYPRQKQHNSLLGQSLCEHQEIEAESGRRVHFHQFLTRARYYYSQPCCASHSVIIAQPQPPAPRYRLETCNILGRAVEPDINTFKERRRWTEEGNNRILLPNNKVLFNFQTSVKLRIHLCSLPMLAAVTMPVQNKQCGRKNQTKPDLPFISPSGGHTVTATAWPPINAATNPRRVMAKIGSGGIQILLENRLSGKPNNKLGVRENKSGKLHRTNPNSPEEKLKSIET